MLFLCRDKAPASLVAMASLLVLGGVLPLTVAFVAQFGFHLAPCHFCLLERYPYLLVTACGIGTLLTPRMGLRWRFFVALGIMGWLATALLAVVHVGIEQGILNFTGGCVAQAAADTSLDALRAQINAAPIVACNEVSASFLGLSLAAWNALCAFGLIALAFAQYPYERARLVQQRH